MRRPGARRWALVPLLGLALLLLACGAGGALPRAATPTATPPGGAANPYPLLADLQGDPAAALALPGADALTPLSSERYRTLQGYRGPSLGGIYGTQMDADAVFAYYDGALRGTGWAFVPGGADRGSTEERAWLWCAPGRTYRLAIDQRDRAYDPALYRGQTYRTVYNARLFGQIAGGRCP